MPKCQVESDARAPQRLHKKRKQTDSREVVQCLQFACIVIGTRNRVCPVNYHPLLYILFQRPIILLLRYIQNTKLV